jgi:hypothetical protein
MLSPQISQRLTFLLILFVACRALCGGPCPYDPSDWYNYYWLYDVEDIANADNPWEPQPYAYGIWELPYATDPGSHRVIGATVGDGVLYVALSNAAQVGTYDRPPLILTFDLPG